MALINSSQETMVPDSRGGWYWLRQNGKWAPVEVKPAGGGWAASIILHSHVVEVEDVDGDWGPQISPPA